MFQQNSNTTKAFSYYDVLGGHTPPDHFTSAQHLSENGVESQAHDDYVGIKGRGNSRTKFIGAGCGPCSKKKKLIGMGVKPTGGGFPQKGYGRNKACAVGHSCCEMASQIGKGIHRGLGGDGKLFGAGWKDMLRRAAPKFKKHLPMFAKLITDRVIEPMNLGPAGNAVKGDLTRFFLAQARAMAAGKQVGGAKWWNKIKNVVGKIKHFLKDTPVGKAIRQGAKAIYKNVVPGSIRNTIDAFGNSALGKSALKALDASTG